MKPSIINIITIFIIFFNLPTLTLPCPLLLRAFNSITNLPHNLPTLLLPCSQITTISLPSLNLSGTLSWSLLSNLSSLRSIDLSHNSLHGSLPSALFFHLSHINLANNKLGGPLRFPADHHSSLTYLNLSSNKFTSAGSVSSLRKLKILDLSHNKLGYVPPGLHDMVVMEYLDVSCNSMSGKFPSDFPDMETRTSTLRFLNVSFNNLTGKVGSGAIRKYGSSAFLKAGLRTEDDINIDIDNRKDRRHYKMVVLVGAIVGVSSVVLAVICGMLIARVMKRRRRRKMGMRGWREEEKGEKEAEEVAEWVAEARWGAAVVVFEKPLLELTFADLAAATSGFGREAQMAAEGGRSGAMYRATLAAAGDLEVVVRVVERVAVMDDGEEVAVMREVGRLRHPNLLPLLGYCIAGKHKLLLYEYMKRGDLYQWLHELPSGHPDDDWGDDDAWEPQQSTDIVINSSTKSTTRDWPTRNKIALGIARGLAFLSGRGVVHSHLVLSNILLDDDLEPRIADFATGTGEGGGGETTESNVYSYGVLVMELVTGRGRGRWTPEAVEKLRKLVRDGRGALMVDARMRMEEGSDAEREAVECLRVGYLCTATAVDKRPTMQQVVGLVKDIRSSSATSSSSLS